MNWSAIIRPTPVQIGLLLVLSIVVVYPFFGPRVPSGLLFLLGAWLVWRQRREILAVPAQRRWGALFLLLFLPVVASMPGSVSVRHSASVAGALAIYYFAGVAMLYALRADRDRVWLARAIAVVLVFWVADSAVQYLFGRDLFGVPTTSDGRVIGPFANSLMQPVLIVYLAPLLFWVLLPHHVIPALLAFLATSIVAMLGGVRTVLVWVVVSAAGLLFKLPRSRWKWPATGLTAVALVLAVGLSPSLHQRLPGPGDLSAPGFETVDRILSHRLTIWHTAANMVLDRPVTGVGAGAFAVAYDRYSTRPDDMFRGGERARVYHAHQLYVGIAAETGMTGLLALLVLIGLCVRWYLRASPGRRHQAWPFAWALVIYAFPLNSQMVLYTHRLFPVLLLLLCAMLAALDDQAVDGNPAANP